MRFPREWFGPTDELVPFGPSARTRSQQRVDAPPDFWGEDSAMLQDVIEGPRQPQRGVTEGEGGEAPQAVQPAPLTEKRPARRRHRGLIGAGAMLASAAAAAPLLGIVASGHPNSHRTVLSVASAPSHGSAAVQPPPALRARPTIGRTQKRPVGHPSLARPASTVVATASAASTPVSAAAASSSTPVSNSIPSSAAPSTPRPSYDSSAALSRSPGSGSQSGGAFTLGGP